MAKTATPTAETPRQKMEAILKQMGGKEELIAQFGSLLETWTTDQKTILEGKYKQKLDAAKKMCLEDTTQFKANLARRLQIFLESRAEKMESTMAKQVAIKESAAEADLKKVKALLEGVEINGQGEVDLQGLKTKIGQLEKKTATLKEERDSAVTKANRANGIAQKALERNRILESAVKTGKTVTESVATTAPAAPVVAAPKAAPAPARRTSGTPTTTNVVTEGVQNGKPADKAPVAATPTGTMTGWDPSKIAASMD